MFYKMKGVFVTIFSLLVVFVLTVTASEPEPPVTPSGPPKAGPPRAPITTSGPPKAGSPRAPITISGPPRAPITTSG